MKYIINLFAAAALLVACNESLEDTYSDYAGDGKVRYVAKCTEFHAIPRWEGILLEWQNGTDATIDKIKLVWTVDGNKDSVSLQKTSTSYELKNLPDGTYRFDICAVDMEGNESLGETTYERPYTREHEIMRTFTRGVVKAYFLKEKMIFFSDMWNENIVEMKLKYKDTHGGTQYYTFDKNAGSYNSFITINDVSMNPADTIYVHRKGKLDGCPDLIEFDPLAISRVKNFSAGFVNAIQRRYGYGTDTQEEEVKFNEFVENVEELEFDYDMETFEDVLYCPNLKKLVFGKNRYLYPNNNYNNAAVSRSNLRGEEKKSVTVLNKANELLGLTIDCYGNNNKYYTHYFSATTLPTINYIVNKGYAQLPADMKIVGMDELKTYNTGSKVACTPTDPYAVLDNLLDNSYDSRWETTSSNSLREYSLIMEFIEDTEIRGVKVAQALYIPGMDTQTPNFMPSMISMQTSTDGVNWKDLTFFESNELGRGSGEVTLLPVAEGSRIVRFIKFSVRDGIDVGGFCMMKLSDVIPYK